MKKKANIERNMRKLRRQGPNLRHQNAKKRFETKNLSLQRQTRQARANLRKRGPRTNYLRSVTGENRN